MGKHQCLISNRAEPSDIILSNSSESIGDGCPFLSSVAALAENSKIIKNIFDGQEYNPNGIYKVALRIDGQIE